MASDAAIKEATKKLQDKVDQLQAELEKSRNQYDAVAQGEGEPERQAAGNEHQARAGAERTGENQGRGSGSAEPARQAEESLKKIAGSDRTDNKKQEALRAEIAQLKKALASAEKGRAAAEKEKDEESEKLTAVTKERNQLLAELKTAKQAQERVQVLVTENSDLKNKLASAEKTVREISEDKPKKEQEVAEVKRQVEQLRQQLAASQKQNKDFEVTVADLRSQLEEASTELEKAKLTGANAGRDRAADEGKRDAAQDRDARAAGGSAARTGQEADAGRVRKIADQIRYVEPADRASGAAGHETDAKQSWLCCGSRSSRFPMSTRPVRRPAFAAGETSAHEVTAPGPTVANHGARRFPTSSLQLAREAKENFDKGKYRAAEKQYQEILTKSPEQPLFALESGRRLFPHRQIEGGGIDPEKGGGARAQG